MSDPITVTNLTQVGRINAPDPAQPRVFVTYNADFATAADITLDFTVVNQQQVFGIPRALFIDNGSNPEEVEVSVTNTDMFFTVPAYAEGYFKLDAAQNSRISFVTVGGATDKVTITIYNYEIPPNVWYKFGVFNVDKPIKVEGTQPTGTDMDTATNNNPVMAGGVDNTGALRRLLTDNTGRLVIVGSGAGGQVYGPDADGVPPTQPPVLTGALDNLGNVNTLTTNAGSELKTHDTSAVALLITIDADTSALVAEIPTGNATIASVASAAVDTLLKAANANRKGMILYNDSTQVLYVLLDASVASNANYSFQMQPQSYWEMPMKYVGQVRGIWAAANGSCKVTETV